MTFTVVVAVWKHTGGIGFGGSLPWHVPEDLRRFARLTSQQPHNAVIMGRTTWNSLAHRPLPGRLNIVLSRTGNVACGASSSVQVASTLTDALEQAQAAGCPETFVIGGAQVYHEALRHPGCRRVHLTRLFPRDDRPSVLTPLDTFVDPLDTNVFRLAATETLLTPSHRCLFETWERHATNPEEQQYLALVQRVLSEGHPRPDRTRVGVRSLFGATLRFDLKERFPLLTTKRVFFRGVFEELLWFLRGQTDARQLRRRGVKIWDGNGSRSYLDSIGLVDRAEDDLGPIYGFQWRHFGAQYRTCDADYTGQGVDQIARLVHDLRTQPHSRRLLISAWNPQALDQMALPPCHVLSQFYVQDGRLSCQMYQRSGDLGLGVPFNIASYALLTCILAHITHLTPGELILVLGDAHVYNTHVEALTTQLKRTPGAFPQLTLSGPRTDDWDQWHWDHVHLQNYHPQEALGLPMAV